MRALAIEEGLHVFKCTAVLDVQAKLGARDPTSSISSVHTTGRVVIVRKTDAKATKDVLGFPPEDGARLEILSHLLTVDMVWQAYNKATLLQSQKTHESVPEGYLRSHSHGGRQLHVPICATDAVVSRQACVDCFREGLKI